VTATQYSEIVSQRSVYIALPRYQMVNHVRGEDVDGQHGTSAGLAVFHTSQLELTPGCKFPIRPVFPYYYFVTVEEDTAVFSIPGDTGGHHSIKI
jgi:hypothetical protein